MVACWNPSIEGGLDVTSGRPLARLWAAAGTALVIAWLLVSAIRWRDPGEPRTAPGERPAD